MGSFIARQPNGLLCRFSSIVECVTHFNFTDEDYKNNITGTVSNRGNGSVAVTRGKVAVNICNIVST